MAELDLNKIVHFDFPNSQYIDETTIKKQVYLHHTVSGNNAKAVDNWWESTHERVAVAILIARDGTIYQLFGSEKWAYHLGLDIDIFRNNNLPYQSLDRISIGIEILNWGALTKDTDGKWYPAAWDKVTKKVVPQIRCGEITEVQEYKDGFRGFYGFEKYTPAQIESVRQLLRFWNTKYKIPLDYNSDMWDISKRALSGTAGIFAHTSVRKDKSDVHPQPELITMLKNLNQ